MIFIFSSLLMVGYAKDYPLTKVAAPFGLKWGRSKKKMKQNFIKCTRTEKVFEICTTKKVPKPVSMANMYLLTFHSKKGLQKITMLGKIIKNDLTGTEGINVYERVKKSLIKKYALPKSYEYTGEELYYEDDEFYQCLEYDGCGAYLSFWQPKNGGYISLQLNGSERGSGYVSLAYESKDWESIINKKEKLKEQADDDAF